MAAITRETVVKAIARYFPDENPEDIISALDVYGEKPYHYEVPRVQYAILRLSGGDMEKLLHFVGVACQDYRDILYWASMEKS